MLIFTVASLGQYQVMLGIFRIFEALYMFAWIEQSLLENVRTSLCLYHM